ncbi:phosphoenolpyruvate carboxykinase (GTP) [Armatimonas rosea]|uniref:Phosphoenolpyruvate carboxykinase [GTP] n=1 Tax=Armatimonas rosea TaxID=685828 RepID=A0A7W9SWB4_ARMRO|nr:phosphoenolpyruvate carboxykinase (GTP) [Armatimonas rosea]MBB6053588.1 phosphoenolpyruvate carboxykinase (GTP) [Armatimonas rosea]
MDQSLTSHAGLLAWVEQSAHLCKPERVHWCTGSDDEAQWLIATMVAAKDLIPFNNDDWPNCYLHRSNPNDVARVEDRTFICSQSKEDAGPTNNWMAPDEAKKLLYGLFEGCMEGRTMYVVPYQMGPVGSPFSKVGVEITDSAYVALSMRIMTRMGTVALETLGTDGAFVPGLHSTAELDPEKRYICHFPEERLILSINSGYGGNALLGKKCFALRIASAIARDEGWLAEHMLILELEDPQGEKLYFTGAFPSACGKTNLAMLESILPGWTVRTVGDDIAWLRIGDDGRLWAVNPEAGFFGVAPGTSEKTNPSAMETIRSNTLFTNVARTDGGRPWWEGMGPASKWMTDWRGNHRPGQDLEGGKFAQPNSRFTAPAKQCPTISPHWEDPQGVPISGILFGGRRNDTMPLVLEANSWEHGVFLGATMASQTTAAAGGAQGVLRRDPMAMLPFCGYHMGDYFAHWLELGKRIPNPPKIFHVNWFQKDDDGVFLWPGYGENLRPLLWMRERILGEGKAIETPIGTVPTPDALNLDGLSLADGVMERLLEVNHDRWAQECDAIAEHFEKFGDKLPTALSDELAALRKRVG